ncbi:galactose mutarotase [Shewanella eurypsychrophilus]|uniref:Aldose 1-epimerase n=1 Tax=Shewanella eurypsychrophilus TaxID=2593656 RepID=A0ABX6V1R4_9GAMM|nr:MULTISPECIES: aldose epimerase family protein [Shewanella]QFU21250.1 galactose-1-epimerase [Shewanella sp. YLB-09]QPG56541.1 galactose mutarotase [Shewanella eurypsychrophilus]
MVRFRPLSPWIDPRGGQIERVIIDNGVIAAEVLSLGGIIRSLWTPDRHEDRSNIVLGCDSVEDYLKQDAHLGAIAGRYANRVANGKMSFEGQAYQLDINQSGNCLHGGTEGFNRKQWHMGQLPDGIRLNLISPDGDMGFPGQCNIQLDYRLVGNNLYMEIFAAVNKACPISLTQHSYFNLEGSGSQSNSEHHLQIDSTKLLELNETGIPTGICDVKGTLFDCRQSKSFSIMQNAKAFTSTSGVDHCYLTGNTGSELTRFGTLSAATSGRTMTLYTNQPSVQVYGANFLQGNPGKAGQVLKQHQGICLEPQQLPDAANQVSLATNPWIKPGEVYHHISRYEF